MSTPLGRKWRLGIVIFIAVSSLLFGVYYTLVLDPYIQVHCVVRQLESDGVETKYFTDRTLQHRPPLEYGAALILGQEIVDHPYEMNFENIVFRDDDLRAVGKVYRVWALYLKGQSITNAGLKHLSRLNLLRLDLSGTLVGSGNCQQPQADAVLAKPGFEQLTNNTRLKELRLTRTNVNDLDLAILAKFATPDYLELGETCITDVGMNETAFFGRVRWLGLNDTSVTPRGLKKLNPSILESLDVRGITLGSEGSTFIGTCHKLDLVRLARTKFSSKDCESLRALTNLRRLFLEYNPITDEALEVIGSITPLELLDLRKTQITANGIDKLSALRLLRILAIEGDVLASPACLKHLKKLKSLQRVVFTSSTKVASKLEDIRQQLGPTTQVIEYSE